MTALILYPFVVVLLLISWSKNKEKTKLALKKTKQTVLVVIPILMPILLLVSLGLSIIDERYISQFLGAETGFAGILLGAVTGSVVIIQAMVAFPMAGHLIELGTGYPQITAFLTSLLMVGVMSLPVEAKYLGKKAAFARNILAFIYVIFISYMWEVFSI